MPDDSSPVASARESLKSQQDTDAQGQFNAAVDELLDQLQHKFDHVSREMFGKCASIRVPSDPMLELMLTDSAVDDMTRRLDELESSLTVSGDASASK